MSVFNNQNLSLSLHCSGLPLPEAEKNGLDQVVARIRIKKSTTSALTLEGLEARFNWDNSEKEAEHVPVEIHRFKACYHGDPG